MASPKWRSNCIGATFQWHFSVTGTPLQWRHWIKISESLEPLFSVTKMKFQRHYNNVSMTSLEWRFNDVTGMTFQSKVKATKKCNADDISSIANPFAKIRLTSYDTLLLRHFQPNDKMGQPRPLFHLFSSFHTFITIFTTNKCEKMSIQYTMLRFELTTFGTWVSSHNH